MSWTGPRPSLGPEAALNLLDSIRTHGRTGPAVVVRAALVRAQAAEREGDTATARGLTAQALLDARRERLRRPFLDAGTWIRPLLATAGLHEPAAGWLMPGPEAPPSLPLVVELSGRIDGEVAADLYVSVNTVKTHLKSVYRKPAVNRRNDAVRRARPRAAVNARR